MRVYVYIVGRLWTGHYAQHEQDLEQMPVPLVVARTLPESHQTHQSLSTEERRVVVWHDWLLGHDQRETVTPHTLFCCFVATPRAHTRSLTCTLVRHLDSPRLRKVIWYAFVWNAVTNQDSVPFYYYCHYYYFFIFFLYIYFNIRRSFAFTIGIGRSTWCLLEI